MPGILPGSLPPSEFELGAAPTHEPSREIRATRQLHREQITSVGGGGGRPPSTVHDGLESVFTLSGIRNCTTLR
jgi:hypothetical protein